MWHPTPSTPHEGELMLHGWHFIHFHVPKSWARVLGSRVVLNGDLCPTLAFMNEGEGGGRYRGQSGWY